MKQFRSIAVLMVSAVILAGCGGVAHIEKDDTVSFSNYKTFAWVDAKEDQSDSSKRNLSLTEQNIRKAVNEELARQGWRETKNKPDILLSHDVLVERAVKEDNNPVYSRPTTRYLYNPYARRWVSIFYPSQFLGYDNDRYEVREGTITVTMVDARTNNMVWQGWTTDEVNSRNFTSKEIRNSVKTIFRKFDVAKK
jgi:hypothetical protein